MSLPNTDTGQALKRLEDDGSDLSKPMLIDFFVSVPSEASGKLVASEADSLGFNTSVEKDDDGDWTCYCETTLIPSYTTIVNIEEKLNNIAIKYGGYSDGFGSFGNA